MPTPPCIVRAGVCAHREAETLYNLPAAGAPREGVRCFGRGYPGPFQGATIRKPTRTARAPCIGLIRLYELGQERLEPEAKKDAQHQEQTQKLSEVGTLLLALP